MSQWRVSMDFQASLAGAVDPRGTLGSLYGWTENWYYSTDSTQNQVVAAAATLVINRIPLLTPGWAVRRVRFAIFPTTRVAFTVNLAPANGRGTYALVDPGDDEQAYDVLINNAVCASNRSKTYALGGIANDVVSAGGIYLAPAAWIAAYVGWNTALSSGWAVRRSTLAITTPATEIATISTGPVTSFPTWAPSRTRPAVAVVDPTAAAVGQQVRISGVRGMARMNGLWTIAQTGLSAGGVRWYWLSQRRGEGVCGDYTDGGIFRPLIYTLDPVTATTPSRGSSRKRGGAIGRPRGRRSTARC